MSSTLTVPRTASAVNAPAKPSARRTFRMIHLILGLSFGLLLVLQGLSGTVLVWRPELDRLMLPALTHAPASATDAGAGHGLAAGFAEAQAAAPVGIVRMVRLPAAANGTDEWTIQLLPRPGEHGEGPRWTVYTNPSTGRLLGIRGQRRDALEWLIELHHNLLWGRTGRAIQGYLAIATMLLALSGLWLWWPARWTSSRFRPRAAAKPLHYAIGFWAMGPLLVIAVTATYFVWRQPIQKAFGVADARRPGAGVVGGPDAIAANHSGEGRHGPYRDDGAGVLTSEGSTDAKAHRQAGSTIPMDEAHHSSEQRGADELARMAPSNASDQSEKQNQNEEFGGPGLDEVVRAAHAAQPAARLTVVRLPVGGRGPFTVLFESESENYRAAPNSMLVRMGADGTARVLRTNWWRDLPAKRRFLEWLPRLHQGEFGGVLIRLLWSLTGLCPAVLFISGFLLWRRRLHVGG